MGPAAFIKKRPAAIIGAVYALFCAVMIGESLIAHREAFTQRLLISVYLGLVPAVGILTVSLIRSLKRTIYSYRNISLIGAILFSFVLMAVLFSCFLSCLRSQDVSAAHFFQRLIGFPRVFAYYATFVIFGLSVLVGISNVALIRHEGFCLNNALSLIVAGFYIGLTAAVNVVNHFLTAYIFSRQGGLLFNVLNTVIPLFLLLMLCYFECILAGSAVMGWVAAKHVPKMDKDYIIILGCSVDKRGGLRPLLRGRVKAAARFAWQQEAATGKTLRYVPSGGQGPNEIISEGSAMALFLLSHGAEEDEVFAEKQSKNTLENMLFSKKLIDGLQKDAKIAFATTNYHMLRSGILARRAGFDAEGIAGDTKWYFWPNGFVREFFGILKMNVKAHVRVAAVIGVICTAIGFVGYFGNLL